MIFLQPRSMPELASCLAQKQGRDAYLVSGCTDFLAKRNGKVWEAEMLISLTDVPELRRILLLAGKLSIGAACTHTQVETNALVQQYFPALTQACGNVGSRQIRNRGTVGGSIGNASPAGDIYPVLLALDAEAAVMNSAGVTRRLPVDWLVTGVGKTALAEDEVIVAFEIPLPAENGLNAFVKLGERAKVTIAKISLAASMEVENGVIRRPRIVLGAVSSKAILAAEPAATLCGWPLSMDRFEEFSEILGVEIEHSIPNRPTMPYKRAAVRGLAEDVLRCLVQQAGEKELL